ncbi:MAG: P1 family peptidase [Chloroflexi bacterium]|nr:P1 family peptidase [Chloroflexota bacterium]
MTDAQGTITDIQGIEVGHWTDRDRATGCTVVVCRSGAVGGVDVRGSAPGTRETDLLRPGNLVERVHGVLLGGGSAYGLDAASGVMRYLEEQGIGFRMGKVVVPIVAGAIIFDLGLAMHHARPGPAQGYEACLALSSGAAQEGSVGAGTGATVAKLLGMERAVKGGVGSSSIALEGGLAVGALVVVNALGSVVDPEAGSLVAGPRREVGRGFYSAQELLTQPRGPSSRQEEQQEAAPQNTTLAVVATNASLTKEQANKLAQMGQDGLAMAVWPCHTMADGDVVFAMATGQVGGAVGARELTRLGWAAALAVARAVVRGVTEATGLGGVPALRELRRG